MFKTQNKKLTKLIATTFMLNSIGVTALPLSALAADTTSTADAEKAAAVTSAKNYQSAVKSATSSIIQLSDEDDDLQFLNKLISLCTDSTGKTTVADNYKNMISAAKEAQEKAEANGSEADALVQKLIDADSRVQRILQDVKDAGTINVDSITENMVQTEIAVYQQGLADKKVCIAEAEQKGTDTSLCTLSNEAAAAANFLMTKNLQQMNVTSTNPTTTNATEQKGASTIENKDTTYVLGEDGLYHEQTVTTTTTKDNKSEDTKSDGTKTYDTTKDTTTEDGTKSDGESKSDNTTDGETKTDDTKTDDSGKTDDTSKDSTDTKTDDTKTDDDAKTDDTNTDEKKTDDTTTDSSSTDTCPTNYVSSNGQCCPSGYPTYDSSTGKCVANSSNSSSSGGGSNNSLLTALGTLGLAAGSSGLFGGHKTDDSTTSATNETKTANSQSLQYAFNYNWNNDKDQLHYFPTNSNDDIRFKLFSYDGKGSATAASSSKSKKSGKAQTGTKTEKKLSGKAGAATAKETTTKTAKPSVNISFEVPFRSKDGKVQVQTIANVPIELNQEVVIFPKTMAEYTYYKPLKDKGSIERIPVNQISKNRTYYKMIVSVNDAENGINKQFVIKYNFDETNTMIVENEDKKLTVGNSQVVGQTPSINLDGKITGATWDDKSNSCVIDVSGSFANTATQEVASAQTQQIYSNRYTKDGCATIGSSLNGATIRINGLTTTDDGKGNTILSDDYSSAASAIYEREELFKNDGSMEALTPKLTKESFTEAAQNSLLFDRTPVTITVPYADGHTQSWAGYSTDGSTLYDSDGNALTSSQKTGQAKIICNSTQNATACSADAIVDACTGTDKIGRVCIIPKEGEEVDITSNEVTVKDITAYGNMNAPTAAKQTREENSQEDSYFSKFTSTVKDGVNSVLNHVLGVNSSEPIAITNIANSGAGVSSENKAAEQATKKKDASATENKPEAKEVGENVADKMANVAKDGVIVGVIGSASEVSK